VRVILAGGAGTLGGDLVDLLSDQHQFMVIDDFQESSVDFELLAHKVPVLRANLADFEAIEKSVIEFNPEAIIYLATTVSLDQKRGFETVIGLKNLLEIGARVGQPRVLYIQSFLTREVSKPVRADSPLCARDSYSVWKLAGELLLDFYAGESSTIVLSSVISPRLNVGAIPAFVKRLSAKQSLQVTSTSRDYLHPADFGSAIELLLTLPGLPKKTVVGSGKAIQTQQVALAVAQAMGINLDPKEITVLEPKISDPSIVVLDPTTFSEWSQWSPLHTFKDAVAACVKEIQHSQRKIRQHH
jgi:nucleoside-diphosphate-sugar epimerase